MIKQIYLFGLLIYCSYNTIQLSLQLLAKTGMRLYVQSNFISTNNYTVIKISSTDFDVYWQRDSFQLAAFDGFKNY